MQIEKVFKNWLSGLDYFFISLFIVANIYIFANVEKIKETLHIEMFVTILSILSIVVPITTALVVSVAFFKKTIEGKMQKKYIASIIVGILMYVDIHLILMLIK